jgi:hypothetical protein
MASPRGVGHSPFTKTQMAKITSLTKEFLSKAVGGSKSRLNKRLIVENVKKDVLNEIGSISKNVSSSILEKTVLNVIEEVWTDIKK